MLGHAAFNFGLLLVRQLEAIVGFGNAFEQVMGELQPFLWRQLHDLIAKSFVHRHSNNGNPACPQPHPIPFNSPGSA